MQNGENSAWSLPLLTLLPRPRLLTARARAPLVSAVSGTSRPLSPFLPGRLRSPPHPLPLYFHSLRGYERPHHFWCG